LERGAALAVELIKNLQERLLVKLSAGQFAKGSMGKRPGL
jgi:hypothetical protein